MTVVSIADLVLCAVFVVSAAAKLADRPGTARAFQELGGPARLGRLAAVGLPALELAIAVGLLFPASAAGAAAAALVLLVVFTLALARSVARGEEIGCNCFGAVSTEPIGPRTLARNGILLGLAATALAGSAAGGEAGALSWIGSLPVHHGGVDLLLVVMAAALVALVWLCRQLLRQNGRLHLRLDALEDGSHGRDPRFEAGAAPPLLQVGEPVPALAADDLTGRPLSLQALLEAGRAPIVLFTDSRCSACLPALAAAARGEAAGGEQPALLVVGGGERGRLAAHAEELGLTRIVHDADGEIFRAFRIGGTPTAIAIDRDGLVAAPPAVGADAARELVEAIAPPVDVRLVAR